MLVVLLTFRLRAAWCMSLKDKRSVVKTLVMGIRNRFNASACESGAQNELTILEISACFLAFDRAQGDSICESIEDFVAGRTDAELLDTEIEYR